MTSVFLYFAIAVDAFSASSSADASFSLFDRFTAICPADISRVAQFAPSLIQSNENDEENDEKECVWVAVYRSANNKPSVYVKDEFFDAMRLATDAGAAATSSEQTAKVSPLLMTTSSNGANTAAQRPIAVACLRPSEIYQGRWVIDSIRCSLKKENTNNVCDGGSEFAEALCVAVDSLLLNYLESHKFFDGVLRMKSTLFSSKLLEERGFQPVESLQKDMVTHISSLDSSMKEYALRSVDTSSKSPGGRDRAMKILSFLGRIDRDADIKASREQQQSDNEVDKDNDYDPWGSVRL